MLLMILQNGFTFSLLGYPLSAKRRGEKSWKKSKTVENNYVNSPFFSCNFCRQNALVEKPVENVENSNIAGIIHNFAFSRNFCFPYFFAKNGLFQVAIIACYGNQNEWSCPFFFCRKSLVFTKSSTSLPSKFKCRPIFFGSFHKLFWVSSGKKWKY